MSSRTVTCIGLLMFAAYSQTRAQDKKPSDRVAVAFPGKAWVVEVNSPGFSQQSAEKWPDGREYLLANNSKTGVELSITLEESKEGADSSTCPDYLKQRVQGLTQLGLTDIKTSEINSMSVVEFLISSVQGMPVQQKNVIACTANEDVYIEIHVSKAQFRASDEIVLTDILKSARIAGQSAPVASVGNATSGQSGVSTDYFREGSKLYAAQNFKGAIEPYQKALDLEKNRPTLSKNLWRALVDNLGMAYGITGDLDHAEGTFNYGVSKDPDYPMFYYNLACTYAGRQDMSKSMDYLRKAFALKANAIPGEGMPDPRKDDSFQQFMSNDEFRKFAESLAASSN